jgi:hypothetical protein
MDAVTSAVTLLVCIANETVVDPAGIVIVAGTTTPDLFEARETTKPPIGATDDSSSVPDAPVPPTTAFGSMVSDAITGASTLTCTDFETPANVAVN